MEKLQYTTPRIPSHRAHITGEEYICSKCRTVEVSSTMCEDGSLNHEQVLSQLRSHYVPSETETTAILSTIRTQRTKLGAVNQELMQLKSTIERLEAQRVELELEIRYQSGLLSPIRRLPDELLAEIILFCSRGRVDVCSPRSDVWQMEKVCKRWQNVAISTREVWSSIDVFLGSLTPYKAGIPIATVDHLASLCLQRSGERSLSIKFIEIGLPSQFENIFRLLSRCSNRWEDLSFSLSMLQGVHHFENGLTRLRSLELFGLYKRTIPLNSFKYAQILSQLRLYSVTKPLRNLVLPWSQLTYFKAVYCEFGTGEFMEMLYQMPNLLKLVSKWNRGLIKNLPNSMKRIRLRFLRSLELEASSAEICTVLRPLNTPLLSELFIHSQNTSAANTLFSYIANSIVELIRCSHCSITTLSLSSVDSTCVSRILEETPRLIRLDLGYIQDVEYNLHELSRATAVVPELETFSLTCKGNQGMFTVGPLMEILRNRSLHMKKDLPTFRSLDLTLREEKGIDYFVRLLEPLSIEYGIRVIIHSLAI